MGVTHHRRQADVCVQAVDRLDARGEVALQEDQRMSENAARAAPRRANTLRGSDKLSPCDGEVPAPITEAVLRGAGGEAGGDRPERRMSGLGAAAPARAPRGLHR